MNWSFKKVGLILLMLCFVVGLSADNTVFIADGDLGSLRLFDAQGTALDASLGMTDVVEEGWILYNPESDLLIITPLGNISLAQGSILVPTTLRANEVELYLVAGEGTFDSFGVAGATFAVRTPASRYLLQEAGEIYVVSSDSEESITSFFGIVDSYNKIYNTSAEMIPFEKLYMHHYDPIASEIQRGYYLTYGTFPTVDQAYAAQTERVAVLEARGLLRADPTPAAPSVAPAPVIETAPVVPAAPAIETAPAVPAAPAVTAAAVVELIAEEPISVATVVAVPQKPTVFVSQILPIIEEPIAEAEELVLEEPIEVTAVPAAPQLPEVLITPVLPEVVEEPIVVEEELPVVAEEPVVVEAVLEAVAEEETVEEAIEAVAVEPAATRQVVLTTKETDRVERGAISLEAGYRFGWDGDKKFNHTLFVTPSFSYRSFGLGLQLEAGTENFSDFTYPFYPTPVGKLDTVNYVFSHLHHLQIGHPSSWFFLDIAESVRRDNALGSFFAPSFINDGKLGLRSTIRIKSVTLDAYFDDLRLANMQQNKYQFMAASLRYTAAGRFPFSITGGALVNFSRSKATNLYPTIGARLPVVTREKIALAAILEAQAYLPVYPKVVGKEFFDTSIPHFFPNYLLSAGITFDAGPFHTKVAASMSDGKNQPFLINEFFCAGVDAANNADFNLNAELSWASKYLETKLVWNFPLTTKFALGTLAADPSRQADFSQFTLGLTLGSFKMDMGIQHIGVIGTIQDIFAKSESVLALLNGKYAQSFAEVSYQFGPAVVAVAARYPLDLTATPKVPELSVSAKVVLDKRF